MQRFTPREYLLIDMANQFGKDKKTFPQRIAWAKSIKRPMSKIGFAKKPYQYAAAAIALQKADTGEAIGHLVGLDASASGISLMGAIMGCVDTATNCGIVGNKPMDIYTETTKAMQDLVEEDFDVSRADAKAAMMTSFYGSKATPEAIFGEDELLDAFYEAAEEKAPGAMELLFILLASWQPYAKEHSWTMADGFSVKIPVLQKVQSKIEIDEVEGHPSIQYTHYVNEGTAEGLSLAANFAHSIDGFIVREMARRCMYSRGDLVTVRNMLLRDIDEQVEKKAPTTPMYERLYWAHGFISLSCIEYMLRSGTSIYSLSFKDTLLELIDDVLEYESFELLFVHDEFKCHPNHANRMREVYLGILAEIADSSMGQEIIRNIRNDESFQLEKFTPDLGDMIREGNYAIS